MNMNKNTANNQQREAIVKDLIEVKLKDTDSFLKVKETLTRIGIANKKRDTLTQTAHILQKRGKYYIVHFLELFKLDGKKSTITKEDKKRVVAIAELLEEWDLVSIVNKESIDEDMKNHKPFMLGLTVLDYKSKKNWKLVQKYTIGKYSASHQYNKKVQYEQSIQQHQ